MDLHTRHGKQILIGIILAAAGLVLTIAAFFSGPGTETAISSSANSSVGATASLLLIAGIVVLFLAYREDRGMKLNFFSFMGEGPVIPKEEMPTIPREGYITAKIIGVSRNLRTQGEEEAYHVVCEYTEQESGKVFRYSSDALRSYPGREIIGKTVRVYLDANEAGNYRVDLGTIGK